MLAGNCPGLEEYEEPDSSMLPSRGKQHVEEYKGGVDAVDEVTMSGIEMSGIERVRSSDGDDKPIQAMEGAKKEKKLKMVDLADLLRHAVIVAQANGV